MVAVDRDDDCGRHDEHATTVAVTTRTIWHLYPPPHANSQHLKPGTLVYIRPKSSKAGQRGRIIQVLSEQEQQQQADCNTPRRAVVQLLSPHGEPHKSTNVKLQRCIPIYDTRSTATREGSTIDIILTRDTHPFRHLCASQITNQDRVLEIGCSTGQASVVILRHCTSHWLGFDVSSEMIRQARNTLLQDTTLLPDPKKESVVRRLWKLDVLKDPCFAENVVRQHLSIPTVVCIDIGGNRDVDSVVRVLQWVLSVFTPRLVLVKSRKLLMEECTSDSDDTSDKSSVVEIADNGLLLGADEWFQTRHSSFETSQTSSPSPSAKSYWPSHPLQAPLVVSPIDETTPICRYHNYHKYGCKKAETSCPFDHVHCHACRKPGHTACNCPTRRNRMS